METLIALIIVLAAAVYLVVVFRKRAKGQGGCQCTGKCGNRLDKSCGHSGHK